MRTIEWYLIPTSFSCNRSVNLTVVSTQTTTWLQAWQSHVSVGSDVHMSTMGEIRGQWKCEIHPQHRSRGVISAPSRGAGLSDQLRANLWDPMRIATCQKHGYDMIASLEDRFWNSSPCSFCKHSHALAVLLGASCTRCVPTSHTDLLSSRVSYCIVPSEIRCWNPESLEIVQKLSNIAVFCTQYFFSLSINTISRSVSESEYPFSSDEIDTKSPKVQLGQLPQRHRCPSTRPPELRYFLSYWLCHLQKWGKGWEWFVS